MLTSWFKSSQLWGQADSGALDGLVYVGAITDENPRTKEAREVMEAANDDDYVMTDYDAQAYSAVKMVANAIEETGSAEPADVHKALNSTSGFEAYYGLPDFTVSYTEDDHDGADGACGVVFTVFDGSEPSGAWDEYQPSC